MRQATLCSALSRSYVSRASLRRRAQLVKIGIEWSESPVILDIIVLRCYNSGMLRYGVVYKHPVSRVRLVQPGT
jgi:hypothetical protein